jgi:hypothetical protein
MKLFLKKMDIWWVLKNDVSAESLLVMRPFEGLTTYGGENCFKEEPALRPKRR